MEKIDERSQTTSKSVLLLKKGLLCVRWDWKGIVCYELLLVGKMINSLLYSEQLER